MSTTSLRYFGRARRANGTGLNRDDSHNSARTTVAAGVDVHRFRTSLGRFAAAITMAMALTAATGSCGGSCGKRICFGPGVYLYLGLQYSATSAEICIDNDCKTLPVAQGDGNLTGSDEKYRSQVQDALPSMLSRAGMKVAVSITLLDASGTQIGKLVETRTVPSGRDECSCVFLAYSWRDGDLRFG